MVSNLILALIPAFLLWVKLRMGAGKRKRHSKHDHSAVVFLKLGLEHIQLTQHCWRAAKQLRPSKNVCQSQVGEF